MEDLQTREKRMGIVEGKHTWLWSLPLSAIAVALLTFVYLNN